MLSSDISCFWITTKYERVRGNYLDDCQNLNLQQFMFVFIYSRGITMFILSLEIPFRYFTNIVLANILAANGTLSLPERVDRQQVFIARLCNKMKYLLVKQISFWEV